MKKYAQPPEQSKPGRPKRTTKTKVSEVGDVDA